MDVQKTKKGEKFLYGNVGRKRHLRNFFAFSEEKIHRLSGEDYLFWSEKKTAKKKAAVLGGAKVKGYALSHSELSLNASSVVW